MATTITSLSINLTEKKYTPVFLKEGEVYNRVSLYIKFNKNEININYLCPIRGRAIFDGVAINENTTPEMVEYRIKDLFDFHKNFFKKNNKLEWFSIDSITVS